MSLRHSCAPMRTMHRHSHEIQHEGQWFGECAVNTAIRAAAGELPEVCRPQVVASRRTIGLAPDDVVGGVDRAVKVEIARNRDRAMRVTSPVVYRCERSQTWELATVNEP